MKDEEPLTPAAQYYEWLMKQRDLQNAIVGGGIAAQYGPFAGNNIAKAAREMMVTNDGRTVVFDGRVRVTRVANGYILEIGKDAHGNINEVMVAKDIQEVNELIGAAMAAFRLEDKG